MERTKTKNSEITQAERAGMYINILKYYLTFNHPFVDQHNLSDSGSDTTAAAPLTPLSVPSNEKQMASQWNEESRPCHSTTAAQTTNVCHFRDLPTRSPYLRVRCIAIDFLRLGVWQ